MSCAALRDLLRRCDQTAAGTAPTVPAIDPAAPSPQIADPMAWPPARLAINDRLWGRGFIFPGGESETVNLARPMGISAAGSLLLVGVGSGGPADAVARNLGAWVAGHESEAGLLAAARSRLVADRFGKKIVLGTWDPDNPIFGARPYHHCLALEPLRRGLAEPILDGLARSVRRGGHLVISATAAVAPLNPHDPTIARWAALERRNPTCIPTATAITRMLGRLGFDVRVEENTTRRHTEQALAGWRVLLTQLREQIPDKEAAVHLLQEAELWLLRRQLLRDQYICVMRWHAINRQPTPPLAG
ncbi:MAG: hypothetical protein B7Z80_12245 [Rhodospirillales bacterium 20-64-7]|nr:MAG: hypothetical protein B7Z80_12245 [Rhodospirillales bacterium 20-64-7]HQT78774.1 hypothetical protein [Rhodopila sp.]